MNLSARWSRLLPEWVGRRVVGEINLGRGTRDRCRQGLSRHCVARRVLGIRDKAGCLAEYLTLPLANLHPVPGNVPDAFAVFTEPLAAALEIPEQIHLRPDSRVLIIGDGKLGPSHRPGPAAERLRSAPRGPASRQDGPRRRPGGNNAYGRRVCREGI